MSKNKQILRINWWKYHKDGGLEDIKFSDK